MVVEPVATFDWNSIVSLTKELDGTADPDDLKTAAGVRGILALHKAGRVKIIVPGIAASEKKLGSKTSVGNFSEYKHDLLRLGIPTDHMVLPVCRVDFTFLDNSFISGADPMESILEHELQAIIHPSFDMDYQSHCRKKPYNPSPNDPVIDPRWRNRFCDIQAMYAHLVGRGNIFVSDDGKAFHKAKKKDRLIALGAGNVYTAEQALEALTNDSWVRDNPPYEPPQFENGRLLYVPFVYKTYIELLKSKPTP